MNDKFFKFIFIWTFILLQSASLPCFGAKKKAPVPDANQNANAQKGPTVNQITDALYSFNRSNVPLYQLKEWRAHFDDHPHEPLYVDLSYTRLGQNRISFLRIAQKAKKIIRYNRVTWKNDRVEGQFLYDHGKSMLPLSEALPVILLPDGVLFRDGNHERFASIALHSEKIPVVITADYSHFKNNHEAFKKLKADGLIFLHNLDGTESKEPCDDSKVTNDPNRYFVGYISRRDDVSEVNGVPRLAYSPSKTDVWVKTKMSQDYIEFIISDFLYRAGFTYDENRYGTNVPQNLIEFARSLLLTAKENQIAELKNLPVIRNPEAYHGTDNPNVYLADLLMRSIQLNSKRDSVKKTVGAKKPVWVVLKEEAQEAKIAIALTLYKHGIVYDVEWGDHVPKEIKENIRRILVIEKLENSKALENIVVIEEKKSWDEIDFETIAHHLKGVKTSCVSQVAGF